MASRALITGASGFAGAHLAQLCADAGDVVTGVSRSGQLDGGVGDGIAMDARDRDAVAGALRSVQPDVVYHLAALSHVGRSWEEPAETLSDNVSIAVAMLEGVRAAAADARVIWVSSCEVYGAPASLPVGEDACAGPATPYAVSKAAGDMLAGVYAQAYGLDIVRVRPFNHAGPGQLPSFLVSSLARQAAEARRSGVDRLRIVTGNPDTRRDFTDVRDLVRAYRLIAESALTGIYNVSSGVSISAGEQIDLLRRLLAPIEVEHVVDPARVRAHEVMDLRGDSSRLREATGWQPSIPFEQTMLDTIEWWEHELSSA